MTTERAIINTEMMNLFNRVDCNTIKTHEQFNTVIADMATQYGLDVIGESYTAMLKHCNPKAQIKIEKLASGR